MTRRTARSKPQQLGDILQLVLKKQKIPVHFEDRVLRRVWNQAVGPQVSVQTSPVHVKRGALYVKVATPVWMHQLVFLKEEIIRKFNEISKRDPISDIRFSIGEVAAASKPARPDTLRPVSFDALKPRDQRTIRDSLAVISDPELKAVLERVMTKEIGRRRLLEKKRGR